MSKITVTPADEDEVIVAGVAAPAPEPVPEPVPEPAEKPAADELDSEPMPLAQRIVIIAAVVCIIGALVYYFVAMR